MKEEDARKEKTKEIRDESLIKKLPGNLSGRSFISYDPGNIF